MGSVRELSCLEKALTITTRDLEELLEYFESGELPWHQARGLVDYSKKNNVLAISSRYNLPCCASRATPRYGFPIRKVNAYFQEVHAFGAESETASVPIVKETATYYCALCRANYQDFESHVSSPSHKVMPTVLKDIYSELDSIFLTLESIEKPPSQPKQTHSIKHKTPTPSQTQNDGSTTASNSFCSAHEKLRLACKRKDFSTTPTFYPKRRKVEAEPL